MAAVSEARQEVKMEVNLERSCGLAAYESEELGSPLCGKRSNWMIPEGKRRDLICVWKVSLHMATRGRDQCGALWEVWTCVESWLSTATWQDSPRMGRTTECLEESLLGGRPSCAVFGKGQKDEGGAGKLSASLSNFHISVFPGNTKAKPKSARVWVFLDICSFLLIFNLILAVINGPVPP